MKKYKILLLSLLILSCKSALKHDWAVDAKMSSKENWIFAFKADAFSRCLEHCGTTVKNDASPSLNFETLGDFKNLDKTDSLAKGNAKIIEERAVWLKGGDLDGHKAITNGCLIFYNSRELDSIAHAEYKKFH